jgi:hypothetical protein
MHTISCHRIAIVDTSGMAGISFDGFLTHLGTPPRTVLLRMVNGECHTDTTWAQMVPGR